MKNNLLTLLKIYYLLIVIKMSLIQRDLISQSEKYK